MKMTSILRFILWIILRMKHPRLWAQPTQIQNLWLIIVYFPLDRRANLFWILGTGLNASITRIEHMKSLMLLHSKKIETIFDLIPRCKKFSKTVRDTIVVNTFTKLLLLRIVSFSSYSASVTVTKVDGTKKWTVALAWGRPFNRE